MIGLFFFLDQQKNNNNIDTFTCSDTLHIELWKTELEVNSDGLAVRLRVHLRVIAGLPGYKVYTSVPLHNIVYK